MKERALARAGLGAVDFERVTRCLVQHEMDIAARQYRIIKLWRKSCLCQLDIAEKKPCCRQMQVFKLAKPINRREVKGFF